MDHKNTTNRIRAMLMTELSSAVRNSDSGDYVAEKLNNRLRLAGIPVIPVDCIVTAYNTLTWEERRKSL